MGREFSSFLPSLSSFYRCFSPSLHCFLSSLLSLHLSLPPFLDFHLCRIQVWREFVSFLPSLSYIYFPLLFSLLPVLFSLHLSLPPFLNFPLRRIQVGREFFCHSFTLCLLHISFPFAEFNWKSVILSLLSLAFLYTSPSLPFSGSSSAAFEWGRVFLKCCEECVECVVEVECLPCSVLCNLCHPPSPNNVHSLSPLLPQPCYHQHFFLHTLVFFRVRRAAGLSLSPCPF